MVKLACRYANKLSMHCFKTVFTVKSLTLLFFGSYNCQYLWDSLFSS